MATLADALRGFVPPTESALADPIKEHFRTLPQQLEANQRAMDKTMAGMYKTDVMGRPNPNYYPEAISEFTQNYAPNVMGSIAKVISPMAKALPLNRMDTAQLRASLPYKEGGLNLPIDNNPMQRARAMGFETAPSKELYHGSRGELAGNIDPSKSDYGFHVGTLEQAQERLKTFGNRGIDYPEGANIAPLLKNKYADFITVKDKGSFNADELVEQFKGNKSIDQGAIKKIAEMIGKDERVATRKVMNEYNEMIRGLVGQQGYKGLKYMNNTEGEGLSYAISDPSVLRSRFAAFDPYMEKSANPMAVSLAIPMADDKKKSRKDILEQELKKRVK
jgi:hypothetical protein